MSNIFSGIKNGKTLIKRYFLVDYENVQSHGLEGLMSLKESDAVTVYFSKNADTMSFELHMEFNSSKAKIDFQKVGTGVKNALDFQLSSQLGYIINKNIVAGNKDVKYYIVSMDNGFSCLSSFWEQFGAEVKTVRSINYVLNPPKVPDYSRQLAELNLTEEEEAAVVDCLNMYKDNTEIHNYLQGRLKSGPRVTEIYYALKRIIGHDGADAAQKAITG